MSAVRAPLESGVTACAQTANRPLSARRSAIRVLAPLTMLSFSEVNSPLLERASGPVLVIPVCPKPITISGLNNISHLYNPILPSAFGSGSRNVVSKG
jgi:hypothetical protein